MSDEKVDPATLTLETSEETKPVLQSCSITCPSSGKDKDEHWPSLKDRDPHHINSDVKVSSCQVAVWLTVDYSSLFSTIFKLGYHSRRSVPRQSWLILIIK